MDVVRKQIQKLRGNVELHSVEGKGATFSLRLPLTLAIIDGLVVTSGARAVHYPACVRERAVSTDTRTGFNHRRTSRESYSCETS